MICSLLGREGADHSRLRRLANPAFSPKLVKQMVPRFQELANALIDDFIADGCCEFVHQFAEPYATQVICSLLGREGNFPTWRRKWGKPWA